MMIMTMLYGKIKLIKPFIHQRNLERTKPIDQSITSHKSWEKSSELSVVENLVSFIDSIATLEAMVAANNE